MVNAGSFFLAGREWLWPGACAAAVALLLVSWSYVRTAAPPGLRLGCAALKILGIAGLLACLLEPMWSSQRAKPGANLLAIVADNSASMGLLGGSGDESRGAELRRVISGERNLWRTQLAENFEVRGYLADSHLRATHDFHELAFDGRSSALGKSLQQVADRHKGQPLAGIILLTDGVAADLEMMDLSGLPPVYPVLFGGNDAPRDLAIASTGVTQASFEDAPVTVQAEVAALGCPSEEIVAELFAVDAAKPDAKAVAEQKLLVPPDRQKVTVRFQFRPEKTGVLFYRVRVRAAQSSFTEATLANNETIVTVDRGTGPHRVLYVGGRPNWEYKFLQRAVAADDQTQLVGLIRIARREARFEFRGRAGESSNPLFRGFGNQSKEEIERYDRPVLRVLNAQDELELRDGFPKLAEELFKYRAVILDDLEAQFFTADQMVLLQKFVSERGGALLMLGGADSFAAGQFDRTPIGEMLPVYLKNQEPIPPREAQWRLSLTREGWLQHWVRLRMNEADEKKRLAEVPAFDVLNRARGVKPAAMVLATVTDGREECPALVTQRFGRGRTAALLIGDLWQSGLGDEARQKDLGKAWRQIVRWLVADVPDALELRAEPESGGENVRLQARVRDAKFQPLDNAAVALKVQPLAAGAEPVTLTAEPASDEPGLYEATFVPRESGAYRVEAAVANENGAAIGTAQAGWSTDLEAGEFRSLVVNRALMETVARKTGGQLLSPDQLGAFAREFPAKRVPITETWTQPLWHTPFVFLFALSCFVAEWGIRRWKGLA